MFGTIYACGECDVDYHKGAIFTVELGSLIENGFDLGMKDYPIFDENYRAGLNNKIIEHYYFREIGLETPGLFKRYLNRRMNEVMPYYNQLYRSTLRELDPFSNFELWTRGESSGTSDTAQQTNRTEQARTESTDTSNTKTNEKADTTATTTTENENDATARSLVSATPQMQLSGREDYATNITDSNNKGTATGTSQQTSNATTDTTASTTANGTEESNANANVNGTSNAKTTDEYIRHVSGMSGLTQSDALLRFRETFLNIDMMVIEDLADLFMGLYTDYWNAL